MKERRAEMMASSADKSTRDYTFANFCYLESARVIGPFCEKYLTLVNLRNLT
jgi:hypothetical protein